MGDNAAYTTTNSTAAKQVIAGGTYTTRKVTLVSGQTVVEGTVLGKITSSEKYTLSLSASADGSQTPDMVAAQDCDASGGDKEILCYETGQLVGSALTLGTGHTIASIREGLRGKGLVIDD